MESAYQLYQKSKGQLAEGGFNLRKFVTNSDELRQMIINDSETTPTTTDDRSYAKISLGSEQGSIPGYHKILGVQWNLISHEFIFNVNVVTHYMTDSKLTKRTVVSMVARFLDPLGIVTPVTILFKIFLQQLCEAAVGWDDPLTSELLERWSQLQSSLSCTNPFVISRCYFPHHLESVRLVGFCDASDKAYVQLLYT